MPNNPRAVENLKPFKKGEKRIIDLQNKGAQQRHKNCEDRNLLVSAVLQILNGKMSISKETRDGVSRIGLTFGKKEPLGKVAVARIIQKAVKNGDYRALLELGKFAGMSYDQSPEGRGGENNPINYTERIGRPSEDRLAEIRRQAMELGVYSEDADAGND